MIKSTTMPRARRYRRFLKLAIAAALLLWFTRFAYLRITRKPTPRPEYWAAKIAALDPPPPGALPFEKTCALFAARPWEAAATSAPAGAFKYGFDYAEILQGDWDINRPDIQVVTAMFESPSFIAARAELLDALSRELSTVSNASPELIPNLYADFRAWAKCMVAHARSEREHARNAEAASEDLAAVFCLSRQLVRPRTVISALVATSIDALAATELLYAAHESPGIFDPCVFDKLISKRTNMASPAELFAGERSFNCWMLEAFYVRADGDWLDISECVAMNRTRYRMPAYSPPRLWNLLSPLFRDLPSARAEIDTALLQTESMRTTIECRIALDQPRPDYDAGSPGPLEGIWRGNWVGLPRVPLCIFRSRELTEAAVTSVAIERFRLEHGEYPPTLNHLIPELVSQLPTDRADLRPLRYRTTPEGFILYGIGADGLDLGGDTDPTKQFNYEHQPDIVYSAARRGPRAK